MQNLIPKFRQSSIISNKPGYLPEKPKYLTSSNYHRLYELCRDVESEREYSNIRLA